MSNHDDEADKCEKSEDILEDGTKIPVHDKAEELALVYQAQSGLDKTARSQAVEALWVRYHHAIYMFVKCKLEKSSATERNAAEIADNAFIEALKEPFDEKNNKSRPFFRCWLLKCG